MGLEQERDDARAAVEAQKDVVRKAATELASALGPALVDHMNSYVRKIVVRDDKITNAMVENGRFDEFKNAVSSAIEKIPGELHEELTGEDRLVYAYSPSETTTSHWGGDSSSDAGAVRRGCNYVVVPVGQCLSKYGYRRVNAHYMLMPGSLELPDDIQNAVKPELEGWVKKRKKLGDLTSTLKDAESKVSKDAAARAWND